MARNEHVLQFTDYGNRAPGIPGKVDLTLTNDADTTAVLNINGLAIGRIRNQSGSSVDIKLYEVSSQEGDEMVLYDEDNVPVAEKTIANNSSWQLPSAVAGCEFLVIAANESGGAAEVTGCSLIMYR